MDKKNKKILLSDDVDLFLEVERNFLERDDVDLLISKNGMKTLEMIRREKPQVAFLDLAMPELSGDECCRQVKQDSTLEGVAIVLVLEAGRPEDVERCRRAGCDDLLFKPIQHSTFLSLARNYLDLDVRTGPRLKAEVRVYYGPAPQQLLSEFSVDLSTGGLFIRTNFPLELEEQLTIRFSLPEQQQLVTCQARVAWVNEKDKPRKPELPPGMGVQFIDLSLEDLHSIRRFLEHNELEPSW